MVLIFFLTIALGYSMLGKSTSRRDWTLPNLCIGKLTLLTGLLFLRHATGSAVWDVLLREILLLVGSMNTLFATYDIWEDTVLRSSERSDAYRYAELLGLPGATGRCVGTVWLFCSLVLAAMNLRLALLWASPGPVVKNPGDLHASSCLFLFIAMGVLSAAVADRLPTLRATLASASGGRSRIRPWASVPHLAHEPLKDVLLADWRDADGKVRENPCQWGRITAEKGVDVALQELKVEDHAEEVLFFSDAAEGGAEDEAKFFSDEGESE
jgi:hypothetical protein